MRVSVFDSRSADFGIAPCKTAHFTGMCRQSTNLYAVAVETGKTSVRLIVERLLEIYDSSRGSQDLRAQ